MNMAYFAIVICFVGAFTCFVAVMVNSMAKKNNENNKDDKNNENDRK